MDPNSMLFVVFMGTVLGMVLGFLVTGEGYGWLFNAVAGGFGAIVGTQYLAHSGFDLGQIANAGVSACLTSGLTALLLKT